MNSPDHKETPTKTIWAVSRLYYPNFSGAAIQAHRILKRLTSGARVCVLSVADLDCESLAGTTKLHENVEVRYVRVLRRSEWKILKHVKPLQSRFQYFHQLLSDLSMNLSFAWMLMRNAQPNDVLLMYSVDEFSLVVILVARMKKVFSVIQMSLVGADDPGSFQISRFSLLTRLKLAAFKKADKVIGLSSALTDSCAAAGIDSSKIIRIPNGVDLERFHPVDASEQKQLCRRLGLSAESRYVVFVGSALHRKGIDVAIGAFIQFAKTHDQVEMVIVGNCDFADRVRNEQSRRDLVAKLKSDIDESGLADRVHWVGQVTNVDEFLKASDLFFFPTRREGLPNALAEAMSCGLPILASEISGVTTDLVRNGQDGILVPGYQSIDYAEQLCRLMNDEEIRKAFGKSAAKRIAEEFSMDVAARRYQELLK